MSSGRNMWVPGVVRKEIEDIKASQKYERDADAFLKMVEHCRVGREVERIARCDFFKKPLSTKDIWPKTGRRKR